MAQKKIGILLFTNIEDLPNNQEAERVYYEAEQLGFKPVMLNYVFFSVFLKRNKVEIFYNNKKFNPKDYLFFISRYNLTKNNIHDNFSIARYLESQGLKIYNSPQSAFLAKNKRDTLFKLATNNLPITPTGINYSKFFLDKHLAMNKNNAIVAKANAGSHGYQVTLLESHSSFISFMEFVGGLIDPSNILIQPFIKANNEDYRLIVIGRKVVATMRRKAKGIEFRANIKKGGSGEKIRPDKQMIQLATKATQILGLDYAGVDIIKDTKGKLYLVEVNCNPGLEIEKITGINVTKKILEHCLKK